MIIKNACREPLIHFLVIGAALFVIYGLTRDEGDDAPKRIIVTSAQVAQLAANFNRTSMRPPNNKELEALIEKHVREEVFYREALAMGLDQNDSIVRQRMSQKFEFMLGDLSTAAEPDEQALNHFFKANADRFRLEPKISFHQIYLRPDKRGKMGKRASRILADLRAGVRPETLGDKTRIARKFDLSPLSVIARSFGDSFAVNLVKLPPGEWKGPLYSALGGHLVYVAERKEGRLPELAEIRAQVEAGYLIQRRRELKDNAYKKLRQKYDVVIEPAAKTGKALAAELPEGGKP